MGSRYACNEALHQGPVQAFADTNGDFWKCLACAGRLSRW